MLHSDGRRFDIVIQPLTCAVHEVTFPLCKLVTQTNLKITEKTMRQILILKLQLISRSMDDLVLVLPCTSSQMLMNCSRLLGLTSS